MKNDEFAFLNQQLAAMVRDGIPLESALRRLCADMQRGPLRGELEKLGEDLATGMPLGVAAGQRQLPELYRQMLEIGAQSNDLPGVLTMLADHYQRRHVVAARLKGLMVYPAIVLCGSFLLACFLAFLVNGFNAFGVTQDLGTPPQILLFAGIATWLTPVILGIAALGLVMALASPRLRQILRWRLAAFKEASLAQAASAMTIMLKSGVSLDKALGIMEQLERGTPAEAELARWRQRLAAGQGKFSDMAGGGKLFPPLFVWTVSQAQEDLPAGFQRAAEIYQARAAYRSEVLLYSALPCAVLALGLVIISQIQPVLYAFFAMMGMLTNDMGMSK